MARERTYNYITTKEKIEQILPENKNLIEDFLIYLKSTDHSPNTIKLYKNNLNIFFVYNLEYNGNKSFINITKRELVRFQDHALNEWGWSPNRIKNVKSTISSLSNYIEDILDDEYPNFKNIVTKIKSPAKATVWEKSVFTEEELEKLLDHLVTQEEYKKAAMLALAMYSGRRKSELPRFKLSFFCDDNVLFDTLYKTDEKIMTKGHGINGKPMYCYVLKDKFQPYLDLWLEQREKEGITSEWLFPSRSDPTQPLSIGAMDNWKYEFTEFLGKDFYWHAMRHFFTTYLARIGVPMDVIQDIINWESLDMVKLYTDISKDENIGKFFDKK